MKKKGSLGKFVLGAAVGAGLGLLFAPKTGEETRRELKKKLDELVDKAKKVDIEEVKENINKKVQEIQEELKDLDSEKALEIAKTQAKNIKKKADELVAYAKEKGTPVLESAANSVREKTIEVLEETLEKLKNTKTTTKAKKTK